jgi:signal transduction histidine kinase
MPAMHERWPTISSVLALAFVALTAAVGASVGAPPDFLILDTAGAVTFIAAGYLAWRRRPEVLTGPVLIACAVLWSVGSYAPTGLPVWSHLAFSFERWYDPLLALLVLALPARWPDRRGRVIVVTLAGLFAVRSLGRLLIFDPPALYADCAECPPNPFAIAPDRVAYEMIDGLASAGISALCLVVAAIAVHRLIVAAPAARRVLWPILAAGTVAMVAAAWDAAGTAFWVLFSAVPLELAEPWAAVVAWGRFAARVLVPIGFLVGTLRMRISAGPIVPLAAEVGRMPSPARMESALQAALGDPTVRLLRPVSGQDAWTDVDGNRVPFPAEDGRRAVTRLERDGEPLVAIVHHPALREDPSLIGAVTAVLRLGVENERLEAEVRAQLDAVRASRARLVGAAEEERRRLQRDLHDGAQQRLVAVTLALQRARAAADDQATPPALRDELDATATELQGAIAELRELARGIHPAILEDEGLPAAIASLARRAGIPVDLEIAVDGRLPPTVETTAYFAVSEALTNVVRYADATSARISIKARGDVLEVVIEDDGVGGADPSRGTGLRGLGDRIGALDGRLDIRSPLGAGTRIQAEIPVA